MPLASCVHCAKRIVKKDRFRAVISAETKPSLSALLPFSCQSHLLAAGNSCWLVDLALGCWNDGNHGPDWGHLVTKGTLLQSPTKKQNPVSTDP